ncbi:hypothetical protein QQY66_01930 [Streptomyces sp. DG2A-72]|uniref:hypothetical protein n=1 Tax=Streptomyces sp. DG2A-72 TaxID=3051386 RepID=UPI00265BC033|nr:hypothetical protein [Streptomyces sp. DG2A-72]MDO0930510.1 hypothetical protein [Streptomyces sp. DG2A-72]
MRHAALDQRADVDTLVGENGVEVGVNTGLARDEQDRAVTALAMPGSTARTRVTPDSQKRSRTSWRFSGSTSSTGSMPSPILPPTGLNSTASMRPYFSVMAATACDTEAFTLEVACE